jgi:hypothetical protein
MLQTLRKHLLWILITESENVEKNEMLHIKKVEKS